MALPEQAVITPLQKLAGLQNIVPSFDNVSEMTPKYFIESFEALTNILNCSDEEKLLILKSRIKGEALSHLINSPDLHSENNYEAFKRKFLAYFDTKVSLATKQQIFSKDRKSVV